MMLSIRNIDGWDGAMSRARIISYDTSTYQFVKVFANLFHIRDISRLHHFALAEKRRTQGADAELRYADCRRLRQYLTREAEHCPYFYPLYHYFARYVLCPFFGGKIAYANHPRFRVHLAGGPSVSTWHRDTDVTGGFDQISAWLAAVDCAGTNALWIESDYGKHDYRPVTLKYGEVLLFDGGLYHGSVANETDVTRVGFDLRFTPNVEKEGADLGILAGRPEGFEQDRQDVSTYSG